MLKLGVDIDGILGNFTESFKNIAYDMFPGKIAEDYVPTRWDWSDSGLTPEDINAVWENLKDVENFWMHEEPYHENVSAMQRFLNTMPESNVYYITSRIPTRKGQSVLTQTQNWLDSWHLLRRNTSVLVVAHNSQDPTLTPPKNLLVEALGIDELIDDYLPTVRSIGMRGVLLDRPWNREHRPISMSVVSSLNEFLFEHNPR
jgi:5' nucleotidase, deoxy (Pyrimidine), cytosolic type C protein (NT5C)